MRAPNPVSPQNNPINTGARSLNSINMKSYNHVC